MKPAFFWLIGLLGLAIGPAPLRAVEDVKPNIVFFLADDLGFMDIGANNPRTFYETPNIDRLAARGMRFTTAYSNCPVCSPSRASLMTGKYPPRTGVTDYISRGNYTQGKLTPAPNPDHIPLEEVTIAERLRGTGHATFLAGKWHLGDGEFSPNAQGFGPGLLTGNGGMFYYPPSAEPAPDPKVDPHTTDRIADEAVSFIDHHREQPFFAYIPFLDVHTPLQAPAELVAKYERKKLSAPPDSWGQERERKVRLVQNHAVYASMVEQMDRAVGRVLFAIDRAGLTERTIVIFTSDNGGLSTSEGHPTSNLPLRAGKGWPYEGGIRVPLIISAPGVTRPGSVCHTPVITTDFYPTLLELTGVAPAPEHHLDGVSLVPLLKGGEIRRRTLFWHYPHYGNQGGAPCGFVRDGEWKLIEWYEDGGRELYNLSDDPREQHDVAAANQEIVRNLAARLDAWRAEVKAVMPTANPQRAQNAVAKGTDAK
jgi:arylsulfatase A-like enzyme